MAVQTITRYNQFLTNDLRDALNTEFPDNDASILLQGVNYRYQDKIWNIRIAFDFEEETDSVSRVFFRIHSDSSVNVYDLSLITRAGHYSTMDRYGVDHIIIITRYTGTGSGRRSYDINSHPGYFETDPFPGNLVEILTHGHRDSSANTPRAPQMYVDCINQHGGFRSHPQLRPDTYVPPSNPPRPSEPSIIRSIDIMPIGICCVATLLALFAIYQVSKMIHKHQSQES